MEMIGRIRQQTEMSVTYPAFLFLYIPSYLSTTLEGDITIMQKTQSFTERNIFSPLIRFTFPVLFALFLQTMYGAVTAQAASVVISPFLIRNGNCHFNFHSKIFGQKGPISDKY